MAQQVKNLPAMQEMWVWSLGQEDPLKKEMTTHFSVTFLAWKIPWTDGLADYSPKGHKQSDTTEQLSTHTHTTVKLGGKEQILWLALLHA